MYRAITRNVQVTVKPRFLAGESDPARGRFFWAYTVEIANLGGETVQLRSRHWVITDGNGRSEEVRGAGVIGKQPVLPPGERFEYTSGCPLPTPQGIMEGTYQMVNDAGEPFEIMVPPFSLDSPHARRILN